jgi:hypothetical protein
MTVRQRITLLVTPAALFAAIVVPMALAWDELPDSVASHWDLGGTPNGHMPPTVLLLLMGGILTAMWTAVGWSSRRMPFEARSFIAGLVGVGALLASITWLAVDANRGVADWTEAGDITGIHLALVFAIAVLGGLAGWFLAGPPAVERANRVMDGPTIALEPGMTPVWASRGRGLFIIVIGAVLVVIAMAIWSATSVVLLILSIPVLMFSEVRTTVANQGVVVSLGWLGIPSWTVPLDTIEGADVEDVRPMAYGGWGYRVRPGARAVVVRGGPGLRIRRTERPDLVLTVDDPETGAGLINALVARRTV